MLVDDPVKRVDNMTMAWGLEARVPFLDHELVELAARIPPELKLAAGRQGHPEGRRPPGGPARGHRPPEGLLPGAALKYIDGPYLDMVRDALDRARPRASAACSARTISTSCSPSPTTHITPPARLGALAGRRCWSSGSRTMASDGDERQPSRGPAAAPSASPAPPAPATACTPDIADRRPPAPTDASARLRLGPAAVRPDLRSRRARWPRRCAPRARDRRDIAFYVRDPHVLLAARAAGALPRPLAHLPARPRHLPRRATARPSGFLIRRLASQADAEAVNRIYAAARHGAGADPTSSGSSATTGR